MTDAMQNISDVLPLPHATAGIRESWLGSGDSADLGFHALFLGMWLVAALLTIVVLMRRRFR